MLEGYHCSVSHKVQQTSARGRIRWQRPKSPVDPVGCRAK